MTMTPRNGERRWQAPRREADRRTHYAQMALLATVLAAHDDGEELPLSVRSAVAAYHSAEAASLGAVS